MATKEKLDRNPFWWTVLIVTVSTTVIGNALRLLERVIDNSAWQEASNYFKPEQPDYFPLLFLAITFVVTYVIVRVYRMLLPQLPSGWFLRGLLVGTVLFLAGDLSNVILTGYMTVIPAQAAQGMAIAALLNQLINGCILTYSYQRIAIRKGA
jgi:hypothetical protein